ncbi:MAG: hypothetical protein ACP5DY_04865 [Thermovirgaceae bacterium]
MDKRRKEILSIALVVLLATTAAAFMYAVVRLEIYEKLITDISESMPPPFFIGAMLVLPVFGFTISAFLVLGGMIFGVTQFIMIWILILPLHVLAAYFIARWVRTPLTEFLCHRMGWRVPNIPRGHVAKFSFLFLAFPGLPYAAKNYILPLAGVPFRYSVIMNTVVQGLIGLPFIILGKSAADINLTAFNITLAVMVAVYILRWWLRDKLGD